jgi:hypothetical protein
MKSGNYVTMIRSLHIYSYFVKIVLNFLIEVNATLCKSTFIPFF